MLRNKIQIMCSYKHTGIYWNPVQCKGNSMLTTNRKTSVYLLNSTVILKTLYCCAARFTEMFIRANGISFEGINTYFRRTNHAVCYKFQKNWSSLSVLTQEIVIIIIITRKNIFNILVFMIIHCIIFCQVKQFRKIKLPFSLLFYFQILYTTRFAQNLKINWNHISLLFIIIHTPYKNPRNICSSL